MFSSTWNLDLFGTLHLFICCITCSVQIFLISSFARESSFSYFEFFFKSFIQGIPWFRVQFISCWQGFHFICTILYREPCRRLGLHTCNYSFQPWTISLFACLVCIIGESNYLPLPAENPGIWTLILCSHFNFPFNYCIPLLPVLSLAQLFIAQYVLALLISVTLALCCSCSLLLYISCTLALCCSWSYSSSWY